MKKSINRSGRKQQKRGVLHAAPAGIFAACICIAIISQLILRGFIKETNISVAGKGICICTASLVFYLAFRNKRNVIDGMSAVFVQALMWSSLGLFFLNGNVYEAGNVILHSAEGAFTAFILVCITHRNNARLRR